MTIQSFLTLLLALSAFSSALTEAAKKLVSHKVSSNVLALCIAIAVGFAGIMLYTFFKGERITFMAVEWSVVMGVACGLTSMVGYDKVKQAIEQVKGA